MADEAKEASAGMNVVPLPETQRGYGRIISSSKNNQIAYGCGKAVVVRSLLNPSEGFMFHEHKANVNVATFSPNGEWIASGDAEGTVIVWGVISKIVKNTTIACAAVNDIQWSPDGKRIVAAGNGKQSYAKVFMWDSGSNVGKIDGQAAPILSVAYKPTRPFRIATAQEDMQCFFYAGPPFKFTHKFQGEHTRYPNLIRFSPDGEFCITVGADSKIFVLDGKSLEKVNELASPDGHKGAIYSFAWSPDSKQILTASADKTAKIWNVADGSVETTFTFAAKPQVGDMQVSAVWQGEHLLTCSLSGSLNFLDPTSPDAPRLTVHGAKSPLKDLAVAPQTGHFYTCDTDGFLTQYDHATGLGSWFAGKGHGGKSIIGCATNSDASLVASIGLDNKLCLNSVKDLEFGPGIPVGGAPKCVAAGRASPDLFAVGTSKEVLVVVSAGAVVSETELKFEPFCCAFSPDDSLLAVGGKDKLVHVFSVAGGKLTEVGAYAKHTSHIMAVEFSPDGKVLTSAGKDRQIYHWDSAGKPLNNGWKYHSQTINDCSWAPDGSVFSSGSQDETINVWTDTAGFSKDRETIPLAQKGGVARAKFWDPKNLVSCGGDRSIRLWSLP